MSPLVFFILCICLKHVKVEEISFTNEETGKLPVDEELKELIEDGYYKYSVDEVEHEVNYMNIKIFTKLELRIAVKDRKRFWTNGIVPYVISKKYDSEQIKVILEGMDAFKNRTCIHFTPRKNESAFIFIQPGLGCSSTIGKGNSNIVKLSKGCYQKGIVIHELMHVLGFLHEQSRTDRDEFVKINYDNIIEKKRKNFDKFPAHLIQTGNISYDYKSIMHYGPFTFAKNKSIPTIIPLQKNVTIGQRLDFSKKDIAKINIFYNCNKQARRRFKRHDNGAPSAFGSEPTHLQQSRIVSEAYPSNARKVEVESGFAPADYSLPEFTPVRNPRPDHQIVYPPEVYPVYPSEEHRQSPLSPVSYSKPSLDPVEYEWPAYSPVEAPMPLYRPVEQPKVSYFPASQHRLYAPANPRILNYSSVDYQRAPGDYYNPPSRNYRRPEFARPSYTTAGYPRLPYPPMDYPKPAHARPSYTTAGYRRPPYAPVNYPKINYPQVYSSPSYYNDRYLPVMKPYTQPFQDTTFITASPLNRSVTATTTEVMTTATTNIELSPGDTTPPGTETTTAAPTSTPAQTTTSAPTSTVAITTTAAPTSTLAQTTTSAPTSTVAATTTAIPTSTIPETTTAAPTSTVEETTTAIADTTSAETTAAPTSTQEQTSTVITTVGITEMTEIIATSFVTLSPLSLEKGYYRSFGTDADAHSVGYHRIHIFPDIESRTALRDPTALWTRGIVPYEFSDKYDDQQKGFLLEAMQEFHDKTCVRFVPRRNQQSYIFVEPESRCSAHIGKVPGSVNKVQISEGCYLKGTIIHELMHTLGFIHEQNRPDRDQYIMVIWDNIVSEGQKNFEKYTWDQVQDLGQEYDYGSVMHYGGNEFAIDPNRPTLVPLQAGVTLGQRDGFSRKDLAKINRLYNCRIEQEKEVVTESPVEEFKKYFQSNIQRLFRNLLRAIQNFRPSKPKST